VRRANFPNTNLAGHIPLVVLYKVTYYTGSEQQGRTMYLFLQETISREEIVASDHRMILRSQDAVQKSLEMLALPRPDNFLGRRNLIEPPPIELE
jgi:hypothetical protein